VPGNAKSKKVRKGKTEEGGNGAKQQKGGLRRGPEGENEGSIVLSHLDPRKVKNSKNLGKTEGA